MLDDRTRKPERDARRSGLAAAAPARRQHAGVQLLLLLTVWVGLHGLKGIGLI